MLTYELAHTHWLLYQSFLVEVLSDDLRLENFRPYLKRNEPGVGTFS